MITYDIIFSNGMVHYGVAPNLAAAVRRAMRIAQREGTLVVSVSDRYARQRLRTTMNQTYTIATLGDIVIATVLDRQDIRRAAAEEAERAGIKIDLDALKIIEGVTLTDMEEEGDQIVFRSGPYTGYLLDEANRRYNLAVIRA